jgi:hypothetical protein
VGPRVRRCYLGVLPANACTWHPVTDTAGVDEVNSAVMIADLAASTALIEAHGDIAAADVAERFVAVTSSGLSVGIHPVKMTQSVPPAKNMSLNMTLSHLMWTTFLYRSISRGADHRCCGSLGITQQRRADR